MCFKGDFKGDLEAARHLLCWSFLKLAWHWKGCISREWAHWKTQILWAEVRGPSGNESVSSSYPANRKAAVLTYLAGACWYTVFMQLFQLMLSLENKIHPKQNLLLLFYLSEKTRSREVPTISSANVLQPASETTIFSGLKPQICWYTQPTSEYHWRAEVTHKLVRPILLMMLSKRGDLYNLPLEQSNSGLLSSCTGISQRLQIATQCFTLVRRRGLTDFSSSSSKVIGESKNETYCNSHSKARTCCVRLWKTTASCAVKKSSGIAVTVSLGHRHLLENFFSDIWIDQSQFISCKDAFCLCWVVQPFVSDTIASQIWAMLAFSCKEGE